MINLRESILKEVFGWAENPFRIDPTTFPALFVGYGEEEKRVIKEIEMNTGHILVAGATGTGKTTFLRHICDKLPYKMCKVFFEKPPESSEEFRRHIFKKIVKRNPFRRVPKDSYEFLNYVSKFRSRVIIFIDDIDEIEQTAVPIVVKTSDISNVTLVMSVTEIKEEQLSKLLDRVVERVELTALSRDEIAKMIKRRLKKVGAKDSIFTEEAFDKVFVFSKGNPRKALKICAKAVEYAIEHNLKIVDSETIGKVSIGEMEIKGEAIGHIRPKERMILEILKNESTLDTKSISRMINSTPESVSNMLRHLMDMGLVERVRYGRGYTYSIKPEARVKILEGRA